MVKELKFAGVSPVVIDYNGSTDDIYAPITTSSCDISVVSDKILDELYTAQKDELLVTISKYVPNSVRRYEMSDKGRISSIEQSITLNEQAFSIYKTECIYLDSFNDYRFRGIIKDIIGAKYYVNLKFNPTNNTWEENDYWELGEVTDSSEIFYMYDGVNSYKIDTTNGSYFYIWNGTGWGESKPYQYVEYEIPEVITRTYSADHLAQDVFQMIDGRFASLNNEYQYSGKYGVWETEYTRWRSVPLEVESGFEVQGFIKGRTHQKIKNSVGRYIDVIIVDNWVCNITYDTNNAIFHLTRLFQAPVGLQAVNSSNFFTDDSGTLYYIHSNGQLNFWSWKANQWFVWITFSEENQVENSYKFSYEVPPISGDTKKVVITYRDMDIVTSNNTGAIILSGLKAPAVKLIEDSTGTYDIYTLWNGYMTPNMYSQEITQNLDVITLSCIDYVSIMKYVTVDQIFSDRRIMSYGEIIGTILAYVYKREPIRLLVEDVVSYGSAYNGSNGLLDLKCQIANFWDESGKAATAYEVMEELLRPFCMRMFYESSNYDFIIYNVNNVSETNRYGKRYNIDEGGILTPLMGHEHELIKNIVFGDNEIKTNNVSNTTLDIKNTYDKVTAIASTSIPSYSNMAIDLVDYNDRNMYEVGYLNVQRNKTKGYQKVTKMVQTAQGQSRPVTFIEPMTDDKWFYIWNGVYANPDYALGPTSVGTNINWYLNINGAYFYLTGNEGNPDGTGSILNFYGGSNNPTATGKEQLKEKSVEISKKITAYAPDNGISPEFLEKTDLFWHYNYGGSMNGVLTKPDASQDSLWGSNKVIGESNRVVYHQVYDNIVLSTIQDNTVDISLSTTFSRTGIDVPIDVIHNNTAENKQWSAGQRLDYADVYYFPICWDAMNVKVDSTYFKKYATDGEDSSCRPVWDYIRVNLYVILSDGTYMQFNGKDWVRDGGSHNHPFFLGKMMTYQNLYHTEHRYNVLRSSADSSSFSDVLKYSLTDDAYVFYYDKKYGVTEKETNEYTECPPIKDQGINWIADSSEGSLSIKLPYVDDPNAKVVVDIYNSSMLGMTGMDTPATHTYKSEREPFYYSTSNNNSNETTSDFRETTVMVRFIPLSVSYVKAEHLDLDISIGVPESNLGQMFPESDIKYTLNAHKNYVEVFDLPDFKVNTQNSFVLESQSYLIFNNTLADPGEFIINNISGRPECYTVQAYYNWLTNIRKNYSKTFKRTNQDYIPGDFKNNLTLVVSPDMGEGTNLVVSDSWDLKSDRHTVTTVNTDGLQVTNVDQVQSEEIPRKARAERYNLPTSTPRRVGNGSTQRGR